MQKYISAYPAAPTCEHGQDCFGLINVWDEVVGAQPFEWRGQEAEGSS